ncbi:MAG TPA: hypothetical protein VEG43_04635 [Dehalococcoidia bacterium]|nr:hypothetical protein [Dehalococcoidia bacterium]
MKGKLIWSILWAMIGVLVIVFGIMVIGLPRLPHEVYLLVLLPFIVVFFLLGVTLLVLTIKTKVRGMLKGFLLLTGASPVAMLVFGILHNVISGLMNFEEPVCFLIAVIVCPVGFLVGAVGSIVLAVKKSRMEKKPVSSPL